MSFTSVTIPWDASVADFFGSSNWQGLSFKPKSSGTTNLLYEAIENWQCVSTREFFNFVNWDGRPTSTNRSDRQQVAFSLTLSVADFFQCFAWERTRANSNSNQPATPITEEINPSAPTKQITINDLSQLF